MVVEDSNVPNRWSRITICHHIWHCIIYGVINQILSAFRFYT